HYAETFFFFDGDGDGYFDFEDCDDNDPAINPGAPEVCDGIDNNCSGVADDGLTIYTYFIDNDGDGFGNLAFSVDTCDAVAPAGFVANNLDCDDNDENIHPDAAEVCDGIDNNCSGVADDTDEMFTYFIDNDGDGFGDLSFSMDTCATEAPAGFVTNDLDCNDNDETIYPGAEEIPNNGID